MTAVFNMTDDIKIRMCLGGKPDIVIRDEAMIIEALNRLKKEDLDSFAILSKSDDYFIQTAWAENGLIIEKQEGGIDNHYQALNSQETTSSELFNLEQVQHIFTCYWNCNSKPEYLKWKKHEFETQPYSSAEYPNNLIGHINIYYDAIMMKIMYVAIVGFVLFVLYILGLIIFNEFIK